MAREKRPPKKSCNFKLRDAHRKGLRMIAESRGCSQARVLEDFIDDQVEKLALPVLK